MCSKLFEFFFTILFCKILIIKSLIADLPVVEIKNLDHTITRIVGTKQEDWRGGEYFAFRGIPYAKPPIGELRFKDPQALESLPRYIDARYDGHDCPSITASNASENCLILNIYTKQLKSARKLPVLVFIHPGGLYFESSRSTSYNARYLLTKPMILVTFNYRLGTLGFLNLGTSDVPGNAGFKDQVYALRWLHAYIAHFGGDTDDVTLMGYSAGGVSVGLHLVSQMSRGLFHKAIVMSGIFPPQTIVPQGAQMQLAIRQAKELNCSTIGLNEMSTNVDGVARSVLKCLNKCNGTQIAATLLQMFDFGKYHPLYLWRPILEHDFGQSTFLTQDFYTLIERGDFERVPLLIGFADGEFCTAAAEILTDQNLRQRLHEDFETVAPLMFMYEDQANMSFLNQAILYHYNGADVKKLWSFDPLCNAISDALIRVGSHRLSKLASKYVDVYNYKFVYRGDTANFNSLTKNPRVAHADDLNYLLPKLPPDIQQANNKTTNDAVADADAKIVELYTNFIWDFITNGKISTNSANFPKSYALINATLIPQNGINFDEANFWEKLFP